jgi:hypothetical protein
MPPTPSSSPHIRRTRLVYCIDCAINFRWRLNEWRPFLDAQVHNNAHEGQLIKDFNVYKQLRKALCSSSLPIYGSH